MRPSLSRRPTTLATRAGGIMEPEVVEPTATDRRRLHARVLTDYIKM